MPAWDRDTALIVVDVQNDFADPAGSLSVKGGDEVVGTINALIGQARAAGSPVFYTQDWHPEQTPHFKRQGGIWPDHGVQGTWGAELHPELLVVGPIVRKGAGGEDGYSGFTMRHPVTGVETTTELIQHLEEAGIKRVVVVGLATDYCVKETALDARELGLETLVVTDAIRAVNLEPGDGERALREMAAAGVEIEGGS
jgi:nicotinamidase/pyrazinamidase